MTRMAYVAVAMIVLVSQVGAGEPRPLFDGKTFDGWEGETNKTFRIEDGAIVGGTLKEKVPHNEFLCTTREYTNFVLKLECRLVGASVNAGIQVRSTRIPNHYEIRGYQADMSNGGRTGYWGCLYDESRRNKMLAKPDPALKDFVKQGDWNVYEIRCEGRNIKLVVNGVQTVDYTEADESIPLGGVIGLQIHGGGPSEAWYRNITIKELR